MSGIKDLAKGGWHPKGKGPGGKESWRGDFKGINTVAGWMGKGKGPDEEEASDHVSAPLSTLKDPSSFGPPPKHVNYHGAAAVSSGSSSAQGGLGAPLTQEESTAKQRLQARREAQAREEEEANKPPPGPYRADTTGLATANLPKPPARRLDQSATPTSATASAKPPPKLPPRLPPRQNSHPNEFAEAPPPPYSEPLHHNNAPGSLNQGAMDRLGRAGVAVPGLNIGRNASPTPPPVQTPTSPTTGHGSQLSELQSRFAKLSTPSSGVPTPSTGAQGTSWADKQAALRTAGNFRNDPSKVSVSDLRGAASTANNFRERHGEQAASGWQKANSLNQKYGIADRINTKASPSSPIPPSPQSPTHSGIGRRPPPPPPKKKKLAANNGDAPPPIPISSKPKF
ncbi:hypothetical protein BDV96DRAFT_641835 [Lophiotrema nucula]|uniref:Uncharacterized protein n=1 Tax=Lophiotrema nucula TaxID=690887 RepID=A0A6A5ZP21_9PLEO|nr:hypothetical protein BDV96DRAFT_641835 [Lophiotrema nucula]